MPMYNKYADAAECSVMTNFCLKRADVKIEHFFLQGSNRRSI